MATRAPRKRERPVRVRREALVVGNAYYQGGEEATQAVVVSRQPDRRFESCPWCSNTSPSASCPRPPPSQGGNQGSSPCGDAHAPAVRMERTPRYERGDWRFESSRGYIAWGAGELGSPEPHRGRVREPSRGSRFDASMVQQESAGTTSRRRGCDSLRSHRACSSTGEHRAHIPQTRVRLPPCVQT